MVSGSTVIPGFTPLPLLGSRLAVVRLLVEPIATLRRLYREYGQIAALNRGDPTLVCAFGPGFNQQLLPSVGQFHNFADLPMRVPPGSVLERFNQNLVAMNGDRHRRQRRMMRPAFSRQVLGGYHDDMVALIGRRLDRWPEGGQLDVAREMSDLVLEVLMNCMFGLEVGEESAELGDMAARYLRGLVSLRVIMMPLDVPWTPYGRFLRFCEGFEARLLSVIRERRERHRPARDVLSLLISAHDDEGKGLTDEELIGHVSLLLLAGHETTAYALTWTLLLLAQHPEVYADLLDEVDGKLHGGPPSPEQLAELPLLDAVIKESMRLFPPTYMLFFREGRSPFQLGPYSMPVGSRVVLSPLVTHRMEEIYPEPNRFIPTRWFGLRPSLFEYFPFGAGPRRCLGAGFAEQEMKIMLSMLVQRYRLRRIDGVRVDYQARGVTLGIKGSLPMQVHAQDRGFTAPPDLEGSSRGLLCA